MSRAAPIVTVTAQIASNDAFGVHDDVSLIREILPGEHVLAVFRPFAGDAPKVAYRPALSAIQIPCLLPFVLCFSFKDSQRRYYRLLKTYYVITSSALYTVMTDEDGTLVEDPIIVPYETIVRVVPKSQSTCTMPSAIQIQTVADSGNVRENRSNSDFYWYTPEVNTCTDIIIEALYKSRYSGGLAPFAVTVPREERTMVRIFLFTRGSTEEAKILRISTAWTWEEFVTAASELMQLPVENGIEYEYYLETDGVLSKVETVDVLEANDRVVVAAVEN